MTVKSGRNTFYPNTINAKKCTHRKTSALSINKQGLNKQKKNNKIAHTKTGTKIFIYFCKLLNCSRSSFKSKQLIGRRIGLTRRRG